MRPVAAAMVAAVACLACDGNPVEPDGDPQLALSPDSVVVGVAESSPLTATVRDASGVIQYVAAQCVSRGPGVATVNANGAISVVAGTRRRANVTLQLMGRPASAFSLGELVPTCGSRGLSAPH